MEVPVRTLKARLSEYLDRAEDGEVITVTSRGRPKALIGPADPSVPPETADDLVRRGIRQGWISPGAGKLDLSDHKGFRASITVEDLLREDRAE
ncbi:MAG: type II toxin-antitoxin system Phd/YefM family antitoxin [Actinomycetota bacterium]